MGPRDPPCPAADRRGRGSAQGERYRGRRWQATAVPRRRLASSGGRVGRASPPRPRARSEEHTSELQSLMRISYAVFCLKKTTHMIHDAFIKTANENADLQASNMRH